MWQLCCWASTSPLPVFVIGASSSRYRWLFVFLRQSTCVLCQQSTYTALGFCFSGLWKHYSPFSSPWKSIRDLLEKKAIAWGSKWIQERSRVVWVQMIHAPVSPNETVKSVSNIKCYASGNPSWPGGGSQLKKWLHNLFRVWQVLQDSELSIF